MSRYGLIPAVLLLSFLVSCGNGDKNADKSQAQQSDPGMQLEFTKELAFLRSSSQHDTVTTIEVAVAQTEMEKNQGLMDVKELPSNKGMLFLFNQEKPRSFWMANTPIPLDIIFVNSDKTIIRIHHSAQPYSQQQFKSSAPAKYVIETNGGFCINHDIREGMRVRF